MPRVIAALCALMLLAGCASAPSSSAAPRRQPNPVASSSQPKPSSSETSSQPQPSSSETPSEAEEEACPLDIADISLSMTVEPYHNDTYELRATYTNTSPLTFTFSDFDILDKSSNSKHSLSTGDTILSGETSPNFRTFVETASVDDIVILKARFAALDSNDNKWRIDYDYKLDKYDWYMVKD